MSQQRGEPQSRYGEAAGGQRQNLRAYDPENPPQAGEWVMLPISNPGSNQAKAPADEPISAGGARTDPLIDPRIAASVVVLILLLVSLGLFYAHFAGTITPANAKQSGNGGRPDHRIRSEPTAELIPETRLGGPDEGTGHRSREGNPEKKSTGGAGAARSHDTHKITQKPDQGQAAMGTPTPSTQNTPSRGAAPPRNEGGKASNAGSNRQGQGMRTKPDEQHGSPSETQAPMTPEPPPLVLGQSGYPFAGTNDGPSDAPTSGGSNTQHPTTPKPGEQDKHGNH